jgi:NitT/TauT family transport system permease protein
VFILLLLGGEFLIPLLKIPTFILPTPSMVFEQLAGDLGSIRFWGHVLTTLREIVFGCVLGGGVGFGLGVLLTQSSFLEAVMTPYIVALQSVPKVALAPVIVVGFGYGEFSKVVIAAIIAFFPLLINVTVGIRSTPGEQLELMRALRASRLQVLRWVQLPHALPTIFAGLEVAVVFSVVGAIVGEFSGASAGLGYLINQQSFSLNQAAVFATLIVLSAIGLALDFGVRWLGHYLVRWQRLGEKPGL